MVAFFFLDHNDQHKLNFKELLSVHKLLRKFKGFI